MTLPPRPLGVELPSAVSNQDLIEVAEAQNDAYGRAVTTEHDVTGCGARSTEANRSPSRSTA